jgi:hypothetical protein
MLIKNEQVPTITASQAAHVNKYTNKYYFNIESNHKCYILTKAIVYDMIDHFDVYSSKRIVEVAFNYFLWRDMRTMDPTGQEIQMVIDSEAVLMPFMMQWIQAIRYLPEAPGPIDKVRLFYDIYNYTMNKVGEDKRNGNS